MRHLSRILTLLLVVLLVSTGIPWPPPIALAGSAATVDATHARLAEAIVLYTGSPKALVGNRPVALDTTSSLTKPLLRNSRTLVPVRFVSEKLGAAVTWSSANRSVAISLGDIWISLSIDSKLMTVNGRQISLDVAPVVSNQRTYVPLRAISEAFGSSVFYERSLIVISDTPVLRADQDAALISEAISWFRIGTFPRYAANDLSVQQVAALETSVVVVLGYDASGQPISQGSGFAIAPGLFATCFHVLEGSQSYEIVDSKGTRYPAEGAVAYSVDYDLAVLKSAAASSIPPLELGSVDGVVKGEPVVAIGSPEGLTNTISTGIVSNIHSQDGASIIQISAALAPGSSGGALFNLQGEVIGVTAFGLEGTELNFAVPTDYLLPWLGQLSGKVLSSLPVLDLPIVVGDGSEPDEEVVVPPTADQLTVLSEVMLSFEPADIALHPSKPIVYVTDKGNQALYAVNYETKKVSKMTFSYMPETVVFANGEVYVALLHQAHSSYWWEEEQRGTIVIVNPNTFTVADKLEIGLDPYDLAVDSAGYIYVASGSGQWTEIASYSRRTKMKVSSRSIRQMSFIEMSPTVNRIYTVDTDSSPRDMSYYAYSAGGALGAEQDSPYHGDYAMSTTFRVAPDGAFVFNGSGVVFYSTLSYAGSLGHTFLDAAFNLDTNEVFTSTGNGYIVVHDYATLAVKRTLQIGSDAKRLFYRSGQLLALRQQNGRYFFSVYQAK